MTIFIVVATLEPRPLDVRRLLMVIQCCGDPVGLSLDALPSSVPHSGDNGQQKWLTLGVPSKS